MKFLKHLAAVLVVVAVIVGLGLVWAHASGGSGAGRGGPPERMCRDRPADQQPSAGLVQRA